MFYVLQLALLLWGCMCIKFLRKNERGIVFRLGVLKVDPSTPLGPGLVLVVWPIDMMYRWKLLQGDENLTGAQGVWRGRLTNTGFGTVRIDGRDWAAVASREIPVGQSVWVVGNDGQNLRVEADGMPAKEH